MAPPTAPANGVLPAPAAILKKKDEGASGGRNHSGRSSRKPAERLKVIIRRLPPGLTQQEFDTTLGEEWRAGAGKVNWSSYKPGKISSDFSKPSRPARAYLNVTDEGHLTALKEKVLASTFNDAKNTSRDAALIGPPALEFAPCSRVPLGKRRTDARQGTIDQDPEFIAFLESLTNPVVKPASLDAEPAPEREKVTTTPLIEHLREKKAAKEKAGKNKTKGKQEDAKADAKVEKATGKKGAKVDVKEQEKPKKMTKAEKAAKEAVKVLNKEAANVAEKVAPTKEAPERKPERAARPISVAARIQQDLGLSPAARRAKRETNADAAAATANAPDSPAVAAQSPSKRGPRGPKVKGADKPIEAATETPKPIPTGPAQPTLLKKPAQPPRGPASSQPQPPKGPKAQQQPPIQPSASQATSSPAAPVDPATLPKQAFLKHANPSQGITESLIEEALLPYGKVDKVEIDRKKGFAYVDFATNGGMVKAIKASPVKVAEGAVTVLEKKDKSAKDSGGSMRGAPTGPRGGFRQGRGGRAPRGPGGGRGGGQADGGSPAPANATPVAPSAPAAAVNAT